MDILGKLFGSNHIVKILRLFLFNPEENFEIKDIVSRTKVPEEIIRVERNMLERIGLIKKRSFYKEAEKKKDKKTSIVKKRVQGWGLNHNFEYLDALQQFFIDTATIDNAAVLKKLRKAGTPKTVILSGFFVGNDDSLSTQVDLLIVGDGIKENKLSSVVKEIEADMGKEINYTVFSTKDFKYRLDIRDRLVRDILDFPHMKLVDRLEVS